MLEKLELNIGNNNLEPEGIRHICEALQCIDTITDLKLYLNNSMIDEVGSKYIGVYLKNSKKIVNLELDLDSN